MTKQLKLCLPLEKFERLWEIAHKKGRKCEIVRQDLMDLLIDHSLMHGELQHLQVVEPTYAGSRKIRQSS